MEIRVWRYFDAILLLAMIVLVSYGLAMIYSATYERTGIGVDPLVFRAAIYAAVGLAAFVTLSAVDYHVLRNLAWLSYLGSIALLGFVLFEGRILHGAQRWIQVGPWQFQPSEVAKICVILALSRYFSTHRDNLKSARVILGSMLIPLVPVVLVMLQPDFGTATVYVAIWLAVAFAAGVPARYFLALIGAAVVAAPAAWVMMQDYQRSRIEVFLNPKSDPLNAGYNAIQALISVGAGQFFGRGYLSGSQSQLHFLSVQYADFIFSVLAEELGFVGGTVMLVLFTILVLRGLRAAYASREMFGRLVSCGIVAVIAYQLVVNVGMNEGLLPITGVPLPMVSYGGSSLVTFMGSLGILESVAMRHRKFGF
jgi:rod shape determining protein RodA